MNNQELKKPITWQELKDFVNSIPNEYMDKVARIDKSDEGSFPLLEPFFSQEDMYVYDNDYESVGCLQSIKEMFEDDFDSNLLKKIVSIGDPFLWTE